MGKRIVQECDLSKEEYDPEETVTLVIKKNGKKAGRTYEISAESAATLEKQLVSGNKLGKDWTFSNKYTSSSVLKTVGDFDRDTDSELVAKKKRSLMEEGVDLEERVLAEDQTSVIVNSDGSKCLHMNKGNVQITMEGGKRALYRQCRECRKRIPEKLKEEKQLYLKTKAPTDSRENYKGE